MEVSEAAGRPVTPGVDLVLRVTYKADVASTSASGEGGAAAAAPVYRPVTVVVGAHDSVEDVRQNALTLVNRRLVLEGKDEVDVVALEQCGRVFYRPGSGSSGATGPASSSGADATAAAAEAGTPFASAEAAAAPLKAGSGAQSSSGAAAAAATARTPALSVVVADQPLVAHVRTAPCVHVALEGNAAGPCPVSLPLAALGAGGGGGHEEEVMVSDLVTAAIKALKTRYGPTQAGAALKAYILEAGAAGGRRLLPTFDALPRRLLAAGDARIVLAGVTCGDMGVVMSDEPKEGPGSAGPGSSQVLRKSESGASHAPVIPLPGYATDPLEPHASAISLSGPGGLAVAATPSLSHSGSHAAAGGLAAAAGGASSHSVPLALGAAGGSEELRLESASPSTTSLQGAALRGGQKLPPMGDDGNKSRKKLAGLPGVSPGASAGASASGAAAAGPGVATGGGANGPGSAPLKGSRLGQTTYADSEDMSVYSRASLEPDAVRSVRVDDGVGASMSMPVHPHVAALGGKGGHGASAGGGGGGGGGAGLLPPLRDSSVTAPSGTAASSGLGLGAGAVLTAAAPAPVKTSTSGAARPSENGGGGAARPSDAGGASADTPPVAKKGFLIAPGDEPEEGAGGGGGGSVAPIPPAEWGDFMPATEEVGPDGAPAPPASGGVCLGLMAIFSAGARAQQQALWRARLRAALASGDAAELAAWVEFHTGRGGGRDQAELDAVLWLALEAGRSGGGKGSFGKGGVVAEGEGEAGAKGPAPSLVRVLLRGGATADAHRPTGQVVAASGGSGSGAATPHSGRSARNRVAPQGGAGGSAVALEGATPLMRAAELGSPALVEALLDGGAAPAAAQPGSGLTALHRAILASPTEPAWTAHSTAGSGGMNGSGGRPKGKDAGADADQQHPSLRCAAMLLEELGVDKARKLRCGGDDLVRFAIRHGRGDAVRWLLAAGLTPAASASAEEDDQASCAYLAGQLAVTLDVWDLPPPPPAAAPPLRDPLRPASDPAWVLGAEEKRFAASRRQLLCGAASAGRLDVINRLLDKPPPYDRLRRDELEAALAAARRGSAATTTGGGGGGGSIASQRQVEEMLSKRSHTALNWDRALLPALQRFDLDVVSEWLLRDFPSPAAVDRALAAALTAERLSLPLWQDAAVATVRALIAGGADVNYVWEVAAPAAAASAAAAAHMGGGGGSDSAATGHAVLTPLLAALQAPAPAVVAALLAAGADPRRRDAPGGENALAFAVRVAERAARSAAAAGAGAAGGNEHLQHLLGGGRYAAHAPGSAEAAAAAAAAGAALAALLDTDHAPELLTARNEHGQSPVFMAAVLDLPAVLKALVEASSAADPWAKPAAAPPPPGVTSTDTPLDLLPLPAGSTGAASSSASRPAAAVLVAPPGQWSAVHEAARCGALGSLGLLLGSGGANARPLLPPGAAPPVAEVAAARLRDAFVGAIRGGRVGAAKLLLDLQARGLYERELAAALALAKACAAAPPAPPPGLVGAGGGAAAGGGADPVRYEALIGFLSSRAHVYMDWSGEVLPALRAGNAAAIARWISGDRITADDASRALVALVEAAQPCKDSAAAAAGASSSDVGAVSHGSGLASLGLGGAGGAGASELGGGVSSKSLLSKGPTARSVAEIAAALVRAGADVNATVAAVDPVTGAAAAGGSSSGALGSSSGAGGRQTLLMAAAVRGSLPLVEVLLAVGARVDAEEGAGCTAVDLAILARQRLGGSDGPGRPVLAALLGAYGERRLNTHRTAAGDSALMLAVRTTAQDTVGQLLEAGATPAAADASEPTPAFAAATSASGEAAGGGAGGAEDGDHVPDLPRGPGGGLASMESRRMLSKLPSGAARKGSAVYLAAKMEDKALLHMLLKKASGGEGMNACRTEVQLGALHGGRLTLLEASLAVPDMLKAVPGPTPPEGGGSAALGAAEQVCARLAEQAAVRLEEAQGLLRELAAANLAAASGEASAALAPADSARVAKYLTAKTKVLEEVFGCHEHMRLFYAAARTSLHGLEAGLRQRRDDMASKLSGSAAAQMRLVGLQSRLAASKDEMMRTIAAKRDATLEKVEALFEARLRGLEAAAKRGEAGVQQQMETAIMEVRRTVARRLKEIEDKKTEGYNRLTTIERRVDAMFTRKQRALATKPPAARMALNTAAASLRQELQTQRANLAERVDEAIRKMEGGQRRAGAAALNMEVVRQELAGLAKRQAQEARAAADRAHAAVSARADELQAGDRHDDLLRIVGGMAAEVSRGSAASAAVSNNVLTALSAAFGGAEEALHQRVEEGRTRMQAFLSNSVTTHVTYVSGLMAQQQSNSESGGAVAAAAAVADDSTASAAPDMPPNVESLLTSLDIAHALDGIELNLSSSGAAGEPEPPSQLPNLEAVEEMLEDMIGGMQEQVLAAFPDDGIVDSLPLAEAAPLLDTDADLDTSGLGLGSLRETLAGLDLELPDLEVNPECVDLSVLEDEAILGSVPGAAGMMLPGAYGMMPGAPGVPGGMPPPGAMPYPPPYGMMPPPGYAPMPPPGYGPYGYYDPYAAARAYHGHQQAQREDEEHEEEAKRAGKYNAASYGDRHEDDFAMSYS